MKDGWTGRNRGGLDRKTRTSSLAEAAENAEKKEILDSGFNPEI